MKIIYSLVTISLLISMIGLAINLPTVRADSLFIAGTLKTDTGQSVAYDSIKLTDINTSESIYTQTDANGHFTFNLDNLQNGYSMGNVIQIWPSPISGYEGYQCRVIIRTPCFINNVMTINPVVYSIPIGGTMSDIVGTMWVQNHDYGGTGHGQNWWRGQETVYVPSQYNSVETRVGWIYWDDATTGYTNQVSYRNTITFSYELWKHSNYPNGNPDFAVSIQPQYNVIGGGAPQQQDPFLKLTIGNSYSMVELTLIMKLTVDTNYWNGNQWVFLSETGTYSTLLDGLYYDFL